MKFILNKIISFLRGLVKISKVQTTNRVRINNSDMQFYRYGEPLVFTKKYTRQGNTGFVIDCIMDEDQYEQFKRCYDESPFLEAIMEENAPIVHARQVNVTELQRTDYLMAGNIETARLRLDGAELYGPDPHDPRAALSLFVLVSHPILNRSTITLYPLLDSEGKLVCLDFLGVDNTDLNVLLMKTIMTGGKGTDEVEQDLVDLADFIGFKDPNTPVDKVAVREAIKNSTNSTYENLIAGNIYKLYRDSNYEVAIQSTPIAESPDALSVGTIPYSEDMAQGVVSKVTDKEIIVQPRFDQITFPFPVTWNMDIASLTELTKGAVVDLPEAWESSLDLIKSKEDIDHICKVADSVKSLSESTQQIREALLNGQLEDFVNADADTYKRVITEWEKQNPIIKDVK